MNNVVVVAGAGTGKTHALVERYLWTLLGLDDGAAPCAPDAVLAITFTEKAASEMRARVQRRLGDLLYFPEREAGLVERARAAGRVLEPKLLESLRRAVSGAPLLTFHAFCARVLRDHALAAGLDPAFAILEPDDEQRLLAETAEACVLDALARGSAEVAELSARVALRGLGERKGLVECLVDLHGTLAERGLAAADVAAAVEPDAVRGAVAAAFGAVDDAVARLKAVAANNALQRCVFVAQAKAALHHAWTSSDDPEAQVARAFGDLRDRAGGNWGGPRVTAERRALVAAVEALGAALVDAFTAGLAPAVKALLVDLDERQRSEKLARGFLAFGDLLTLTRDVLQGDPSVRERVSGRFTRILVDEYQDTSPVQEAILGLLLGASSSPPPGRAFLVGDPKQSIYGFRGADSGVFTRALDAVARAPLGERRELFESRRSTQPIVDVANLVAQHALPRPAFGVAADQLVALTALRGGAGPAGEHWRVAPPEAEAQTPLPPHELESLVVARKLREKIDAGDFRARDVAVLVRRGKAAVPLARALGRAGIAAVVVGGDGFWVRPEIADVVAALTLATDPEDELAVLTVLRSPLAAVPDDDLLALYAALPGRRGLTWPRALELAAGDVKERLRALDAVLATVKKRLHHPTFERSGLARAVDAVLDDAGYAACCAVEHDGPLRLRNLEKLRALVESSRESSLVVLARLAAAVDDPPPEPLAAVIDDDSDAVRIMTIHQAKGLEFPVVVLADAGSGLKGETDDVAFDAAAGLAVTARGRPVAACAPRASKNGCFTAIQRVRRTLRERSEAELARLLYVAVTRARDRLYVVGAPRRGGLGSLLGILEAVRAADVERFDALLPRLEVPAAVDAAPSPAAPSSAAPAPASAAASAPAGHGARRVRASRLANAVNRQLGLGLARGPSDQGDDDAERLPPRAAGRLAHAVIALVAGELPEALADAGALPSVVERAARACGVEHPPPSLVQRCAVTLGSPVRALVDSGAALSFEEALWLERDGVVVEGKADLVARTADRTVVVELKLSAGTARGDTALLQASAYAAALEERGAPGVHVVTWALGDASPPAPSPFSRGPKARLARALEALRPAF